MRIKDIENWNRKEHFDFFSKYDNPFLGIVTEIDCTRAYEISKKNKLSFFSYYLHKSILAVNKIEEFKYRIQDKNVVIFDAIHAAATIGRKDGTFGFSFIPYSTDFDTFNSKLLKEIEEVEKSSGLRLNENGKRNDVIHYSIFPWKKFTGIMHARNYNTEDSVPKIAFGKTFTQEGRKILPISIDAHHGLVDGLHVAQYLDEFQKLMDR